MRALPHTGLRLAALLAALTELCILTSGQKTKPTRNVEVTAEQEKFRDPEGYAAIKELHRLMDDDHSGSIDRFESADFLSEDLKIGGSDRARREKAFHHNNDDSITVDDLWEAWFQSEIRDWDEKEAADWLKYIVKLPQYGNNFLVHHVNGIALPRLATQNSSYIQQLGIKNFVHRQKLQLKALDLVLFGFQDVGSPWKDIALGVCVVGLVTLLIVFKIHKRRSKREVEELTSRFSELKTMESDFEGTQQKLEEERKRRQSSVETESKHIEALLEAERRIEMSSGLDSLTYALQPLLRRTYECEWSYINQQKLDCLAEMREATEFVDKMRRKQGLLTSFKLATGTNSGTDDLDNKIFNMKARMEKIKASMVRRGKGEYDAWRHSHMMNVQDECASRWIEIESMCGFSIIGSFGVHHPLPAGLSAPMLNGEGHQHLAHHSQKTSAIMVGGPHSHRGGGGSYAVASSIPPSVQSALYDEFNNGSTTSSRSSAINSAPPYRPMGIAPQQETPGAIRGEAIVSTKEAPRKPAVNDDTSSLSSSNGKSSSKRSSKISDLIKWKTKPSTKNKTG